MLPLILGLGVFQGLLMSWELAALSVTRLLLMIMLADLVTATTPMQEMMRVILPWLRPLQVIGLDPKEVILGGCLGYPFCSGAARAVAGTRRGLVSPIKKTIWV